MSASSRSTTATRAAKIEAAHDQLVEAVMALTSSEAWMAYLSAMSRFHRYSPTNVAMILAQRPGGHGALYPVPAARSSPRSSAASTLPF